MYAIRSYYVQKQELVECSNRDILKLNGDLISANIFKLEKGMDTVSLENFYDENFTTIEIPLNSRLTPSQNAQKYYSDYKKADIAEKKLTDLITKGEEELVYIDSIFDALTRATTEAEISELRLELSEQGYLRAVRSKVKPPKALPPIKFISSDGYTILVGRNNKQNDELTLKTAQKQDIWLHTHNITGFV